MPYRIVPSGDIHLMMGSKTQLVGGVEHFLFFHILGTIIPFDFHIFQRGSNHEPEKVV